MLFAESKPLGRRHADPIMSDFWHLCCEYGHFYQESVLSFWRSMRPATYSIMLFGVWLIGFVLLKSGAKR